VLFGCNALLTIPTTPIALAISESSSTTPQIATVRSSWYWIHLVLGRRALTKGMGAIAS
jgi:hypothetical protein